MSNNLFLASGSGELKLPLKDFVYLASDILKSHGQFYFKAHGSSMYPTIRSGDRLGVHLVESEKIRVGDVVLGQFPNGRVVVHRVVQKIHNPENMDDSLSFLLKGDANISADGIIPSGLVLGRVMTVYRNGKCWRIDSFRYRLLVWFWLCLRNGLLFCRSCVRHK